MKLNNKIKDTGYAVPEGYFEDFELRLHQRLNGDADPKQGYRVPEHYFDELETELMKKINASQPHRIRRMVLRYSAAAAVLLLLVTAAWWKYERNAEEVAIRQWVEENYMELDTYEIAAVLDDTEEPDLKALTDQDIEDYLMEQDTDEIYMEF